MGWIHPVDDYAMWPRLSDPEPGLTWDGWDEGDQHREIRDTAVPATALDVTGCKTIELVTSTLTNVVLDGPEAPDLDVFNSEILGCDMSRARFTAVRGTRFADSKLVGADFGGAEISDVSFERCVLTFANLRSARLRRVRFVDCTLRDVDASNADVENVSFAGSDLDRFNLDRFRASRVDFRRSQLTAIENLGNLSGCLVDEEQLPGLVYELAFALGLDLERAADRS